MSRMSSIPGVRNLFAGRGAPPAAAAQEDDDAGSRTAQGPSEAEVTALVGTEREEATASATTAANTRWHTVMTAEAGQNNPKAAARLLNSTTMSADDVLATLGDITPTAAAAPTPPAAPTAEQRRDADRQALDGDKDTRVDTGGAGSRPGVRTGEGEGKNADLSERRKKRAANRNPNSGKQAGAER